MESAPNLGRDPTTPDNPWKWAGKSLCAARSNFGIAQLIEVKTLRITILHQLSIIVIIYCQSNFQITQSILVKCPTINYSSQFSITFYFPSLMILCCQIQFPDCTINPSQVICGKFLFPPQSQKATKSTWCQQLSYLVTNRFQKKQPSSLIPIPREQIGLGEMAQPERLV